MMIEQKYAAGFVKDAADIYERMKESMGKGNVVYYLDREIMKELDGEAHGLETDGIEEQILN
jgi:hypothetical protein